MLPQFRKSLCILLSALLFLMGACYPNSDTCSFCPPSANCSGNGGIKNECLCKDGTPRDDQFKTGGSGWSYCVASSTNNSYFYPQAIIYRRAAPAMSGCAPGTVNCCSDNNYHTSNWTGDTGPLMHGQCTFLQGMRYCARVTPSNLYGRPTAKESAAQKNKPMMCGFEDPLDFNDSDPNNMPFHLHTSSGDIDAATTATTLAATGAALLLLPGGLVIMIGLELAAGIVALVAAVKAYINYVVFDALGCIAIPTAPSPPPFPGSFKTTQMMPSTFPICGINDVADPSVCGLNAPLTNAVVQGTSTFLHPLMRVQMGQTFPLCPNNTYKQGTNCAVIVAPNNAASLAGFYGDIASYCPFAAHSSAVMDDSWYAPTGAITAPCVKLYHTTPSSLYPPPTESSQLLIQFSSAKVPSGIELNFATLDGAATPATYPNAGSFYDNIANLPISFKAAISTDPTQVCVQNVTADQTAGCALRPKATIVLAACPSGATTYTAADGTQKTCVSTPARPMALMRFGAGATPTQAVIEPDQPIEIDGITFFPFLTNETGIVPSYQLAQRILNTSPATKKWIMSAYNLSMLPITPDGNALTSQKTFALPNVPSSINAVQNYWASSGATAANFATAIQGFSGLQAGLSYGNGAPPALVLPAPAAAPAPEAGTYLSGATRLCLASSMQDMTTMMLVSLYNYSIVLLPNYSPGSTISYVGRVDPVPPQGTPMTPALQSALSTLINNATESLQASAKYCVDISQPAP